MPISSGSASRPSGFPSPIVLTAASTFAAPDAASSALRNDGVSTAPALSMLIRMPEPLMSWIQQRTMQRSAAFAPPYKLMEGGGLTEAVDPMMTIVPPGFISANAGWIENSTPFAFVLKV